jgi:gluconokinase
MTAPMKPHIVVMGVAGCGKSTIAEGLAERLGAGFLDGDTLHPASNIAKMSRGEPLEDADRRPWLDAVGRAMAASDAPMVAACSALKRAYRTRIAAAGAPVLFVHLSGSRELIASRMSARTGHFMPESLLASQFEALEVPDAAENALSVDISGDAEAVVGLIVAGLERLNPPSQA